MPVTLLFKTDHNHSFASRDLIGVYTNKTILKRDCLRLIKKDLQNSELSPKVYQRKVNWNFEYLFEKNQTQGLLEFELVMEEVETNKPF